MIRRAVLADVDDLARNHIASWQQGYKGLIPQKFLDQLDLQSMKDMFAGMIDRDATVLVVDSRDVIVGHCWIGPTRTKDGGELYAIYVHPEYWGEGYGQELLAGAEAALVDEGFDRVLLWVLDTNMAARRFYERQGWNLGKPVKLEEIGGVQVTEVRYEKDLVSGH